MLHERQQLCVLGFQPQHRLRHPDHPVRELGLVRLLSALQLAEVILQVMDLGGVLLAILLLQPKELVAVLALALESGRKLGIEILALDVLPMNTGLIKSRRSASPSTRRPEVSTSSSCLAVAARLRDRTVSSNSVDKRRCFSRMSAVGV